MESLEHLNKKIFLGRNIWLAVRRNVRGGSLARSDGCFRWVAITYYWWWFNSKYFELLYWFYIPGNTPLHLAARAGKTTAVATLLHQGATASMKVNWMILMFIYCDADDATPIEEMLMILMAWGNWDCKELICISIVSPHAGTHSFATHEAKTSLAQA